MGEFLGAAGIGTLMAGLGAASSAADAALQYHYAKKMYQHRYRWAADDMRKAGFNPILAATGGNVSGMASAPSTDFSGAVNSGMSAALNFARTKKDIESADVNNAKTEADQKLAEANTQLAQGKKIEQDIRNVELPKTVRAQAFKAEAEASLANSASVMQRARTEFADELAQNEARQSHNDTINSGYRALDKFWDYQHNKKDFYARPSTSEERNWWRAKKILDSVGAGVNSAVGLGKLRRYLR